MLQLSLLHQAGHVSRPTLLLPQETEGFSLVRDSCRCYRPGMRSSRRATLAPAITVVAAVGRDRSSSGHGAGVDGGHAATPGRHPRHGADRVERGHLRGDGPDLPGAPPPPAEVLMSGEGSVERSPVETLRLEA